MKKMIKERQSRKGDIQSDSKDVEPTLVLPQLAKAETKAYSPGEHLSFDNQLIGIWHIINMERNVLIFLLNGRKVKGISATLILGIGHLLFPLGRWHWVLSLWCVASASPASHLRITLLAAVHHCLTSTESYCLLTIWTFVYEHLAKRRYINKPTTFWLQVQCLRSNTNTSIFRHMQPVWHNIAIDKASRLPVERSQLCVSR